MNPGGPDPNGPDEAGLPGDPPESAPPEAASPDVASSADAAGPAAGGAASAASEPPSLADAPTTIVDVPADAVTDPPVPTEAVEVPPVVAGSVDRPTGGRRVGRGVAVVVGLVAVLAIGAAAFMGYSRNQDLTATQSDLASTSGRLGSAKSTLEATSAELETTKAELATKTTEKDGLDSEVKDLSAQVADQSECLRLQEDALDKLISISELQTDNFNRTADGSAWATADKKRSENIDAALDAFYAAYSRAFEGSKGAAKTQADRGDSAQSNIAEADAQLTAEVNLVNTKATEIAGMIDELEQQLKTIESTCEEVAP